MSTCKQKKFDSLLHGFIFKQLLNLYWIVHETNMLRTAKRHNSSDSVLFIRQLIFDYSLVSRHVIRIRGYLIRLSRDNNVRNVVFVMHFRNDRVRSKL